MGILEFILAVVTLVASGGWFITYRATKRKANGEAQQIEADAWKGMQVVYQQTIDDLNKYCNDIREDRNKLSEDNLKLREENNKLRAKYIDLENQILELKRELAKMGRKLESVLPFACGVVGCTNRQKVQITEEQPQPKNNNEENKE